MISRSSKCSSSLFFDVPVHFDVDLIEGIVQLTNYHTVEERIIYLKRAEIKHRSAFVLTFPWLPIVCFRETKYVM